MDPGGGSPGSFKKFVQLPIAPPPEIAPSGFTPFPGQAAAQKIAQAAADQASAEAVQASARKQAEFARQTAVVQAQYKAEVDKAQAEAAQAGPLAQANVQQRISAYAYE